MVDELRPGTSTTREAELLALVGALWQILDDIDTATDVAKGDDSGYRSMVEKIQDQRYDTGVNTDGYRIFSGSWPEGRKLDAEWLEKFANPNQDEILDKVCPPQGPVAHTPGPDGLPLRRP
jgi:hypothetical protein